MNKMFLLSGFILFSSILFGQNSSCLDDFNYLVTRISNDYPGYNDKVHEKNINSLKQFETEIREKIILFPDSCKHYLDSYASWFNDYHLRISYNWDAFENENDENCEMQFLEFEMDSLSTTNSSLEGLWVGYRGEIAIVKLNDKFTGVSLNYPGYQKNQIIFEATEIEANVFDLITYRDYQDFCPKKEKASLTVNNGVFEIYNDTRFVRKTQDSKFDKTLLRTYIPSNPNGLNTYPFAMALNDSTFFMRVPSFYSNTSNDFVEKYWNEIITRPNLIIDIRNNGGGQDNYYEKLADIIYTQPYESKGVEWYSTKGIIADWEYALSNGQIIEGYEEEAKALLDEMKKNIGGFVLHPYYGNDDIVVKDTIYKYPKHVGIIINENNGSSAEQFLLAAKNSSKVILFGSENTAGVLDYSNVTPKRLPSEKYDLWLPATRSRRLPEQPIDNIGISPDIIIPLETEEQLYDKLDIWVYFVKNYLELIE